MEEYQVTCNQPVVTALCVRDASLRYNNVGDCSIPSNKSTIVDAIHIQSKLLEDFA